MMTPAEEQIERDCQELFELYLDNILAFCNKTKVTSPVGTFVDPAEELMRKVEDAAGKPHWQTAYDFRINVCLQVLGIIRSENIVTWRDVYSLYHAIGKIIGNPNHQPSPKHDICSCDIMMLMAKGCVCGHLKE